MRFRKHSSTQAKRNLARKPATLLWRKSYNWGFLIVPLLLGGVYLNQSNKILPIRNIQLQGSFENLDRREVETAL